MRCSSFCPSDTAVSPAEVDPVAVDLDQEERHPRADDHPGGGSSRGHHLLPRPARQQAEREGRSEQDDARVVDEAVEAGHGDEDGSPPARSRRQPKAGREEEARRRSVEARVPQGRGVEGIRPDDHERAERYRVQGAASSADGGDQQRYGRRVQHREADDDELGAATADGHERHGDPDEARALVDMVRRDEPVIRDLRLAHRVERHPQDRARVGMEIRFRQPDRT
jgi:hypothetical protein